MRTLLVDNYDSFTYNLFQYLTTVNGVEPVVIRNDEPDWRIERLRQFDNVVISPGPGTPERDTDFGICTEIIRRSPVPLLGVCLGHQGIAHVHGATVRSAPQVRHGLPSPIVHRGVDLFAGLPSPFQAVRYHSLAVTDLPDALEPLARTPDGVLMGLRHRNRPLWGVQFHPESIGTEYGHQLLANFRDLTLRWQRSNRAPVSSPRPQRAPAEPDTPGAPANGATRAGAPVRRLRVLVEQLSTRWVDEVVFDRLFRGGRHAFWLDSSRPDHDLGRFSIMGDASGPLARVVTADVWTESVTVASSGAAEVVSGGFLAWLDNDLAGIRTEVPKLPFDFALGWVGYLGYELKAECGGQRVHRSREPDAVMVFADRAVVFDHATATTYLLALAESGVDEQQRAWLAGTRRRLAGLVDARPGGGADQPPARSVRLRHDRDRYLAMIHTCQRAIDAGETYEVCLTNLLEAAGPVQPWRCYQFLRRHSPAPFAALLMFGPLAVLSTSPERFLRISGDRMVESKPIKGTRPRGTSRHEDELLRSELATSEKDRAENLMIVDLVRNDLGRCAEVDSVHVHKIFDVESYATVHQMVSTVRGRLHPEASPVTCLRAAFPGGSMTGAPKIRTMEIIDELEGGPRGVYSGAIGYLSLSGAADFNIAIRTTVISGDRVSYGVGGAIVALSDAEDEFEETAVKATPLLRLLGAQFPGRRAARYPAA